MRALLAMAGGLVAIVAINLADLAGRRPRWTPRVVRGWHRQVCRALDLEIHTTGKPEPTALLVANHVSWLDVPVLGAQGEIGFLSKAEVRRWPIIGWMAAVAGTLFIARGANQTTQIMIEIQDRIRAGRPVVVFPEGTTGDGTELLRFHPRLFALGQESGTLVQPVALRYGPPAAPDPVAPFIGDESLAAHLWRILRHAELTATVHFLPPIDTEQLDRRQVADRARTAIAWALGLDAAIKPRPRRPAQPFEPTAIPSPLGPVSRQQAVLE